MTLLSAERTVVGERARLVGRVDIEDPVTLYETSVVGPSRIGRYSYIGDFTHVAQGTTIGRYCSIANSCTIGAQGHPLHWLSTHNFQYHGAPPAAVATKAWNYLQTTVGNDVWIGANVVICAGVAIGDGAAIGAGAVVTRDVPPYAVIVGVPGRVMRFRFDDPTIAALRELKWWNLPLSQVQNLPFDDVHACIAALRRAVDAPPGRTAPA